MILYIKTANSSFILRDQKILGNHYPLHQFLLRQSGSKLVFLSDLLKMSLFILTHPARFTVYVCWFADYHSALMVFFSKITRTKTVIFAGGQEAVYYKELGKGVYGKKLRSWCVKYALRNADLILPNHQSLIYHENHFYQPDSPHIDGITHYVKGIRGKISVVPNGMEPSRINRNPEIPKQPDLALTVGTMMSPADFINKGFDLFISLAGLHPDKRFILVGLHPSYLAWAEENYGYSRYPNLRVIPLWCSPEVLNQLYNEAKVYLQISITEGMPVSIGEAMLCECIPVGSNVNGIPDAIGNAGVIVYQRTIDEVSAAMLKAFGMETGELARQHTLEHFSLERREKAILDNFKELLDNTKNKLQL